MPETRRFPRFLPRAGANISVTIGSPLTEAIRPLVDEWRSLAGKEGDEVGVGGEWTGNDREIRDRGELFEGREKAVRMKIVEVIQEGVRRLGEEIERKEGRFERAEWCQSVSSSES